MKKLFSVLILILLVSGCSSMNLPFPNPFSKQGPKVEELGPDIIVIQNINTIPKTTINPRDQFSVYFEVKNQEENERIEESKIGYYLYDTGLCTFKNKTSEDPTKKAYNLESGLAPKEIRFFDWTFEAPNEETIAYLSTVCPIRFKFNYTYTAKSQIDVSVISEERYWNLQKAGNFTTYTPFLSVGRGPVKIYFDFGSTLPARNGSTVPIYIKVEDKGKGALGEIDNSTEKHLSIYIPKKGFDVTTGSVTCTNYFTCYDGGSDYFICNNTKKIPLINKKSFEIRCRDIKVKNDPGLIQKTYYILANMTYTYDVLGETSVEIKP